MAKTYILVLRERLAQRAQRMHHELVHIDVHKLVHVALEVGLGALVACAERHGVVLEAVARRRELVQVRAGIVDADHQEAHPVRPLAVLHRVELCAVGERAHEARQGQRARVHHARRQRELAHVVAA